MSNQPAPVAYFCAEYGLQLELPLYAGGLGVLAGDTLKAAADLRLEMVGVGLLYRGVKQVQFINDQGWQEDHDYQYEPFDAGVEPVYLDDQPLFVRVTVGQDHIWVRVWKKQIGETVTLYLLDTDTDQNPPEVRPITAQVYGGTPKQLLQQQLILGIGGIKLLHQIGIHPRLYHLNEGRPVFLVWQLIRSYIHNHGLSFDEAFAQARSKIVYTNHTLVAAGNLSTELSLLKEYAEYYAQIFNIPAEQLLQLGFEPNSRNFSTTRMALNVSRDANGVSQLHTELSQQQWPEYSWHNITNGIHLPTWQDNQVSSQRRNAGQLWARHVELKKQLAEFAQIRTGYTYNPHQLVLGWARRIAGYKQLDQVFSDINRLRSLLTRLDRPVYLVVSGKAYYQDQGGKELLQRVIKYMQHELAGHALFIPNYDLDVAKHLVQGVDVWLNTPVNGQEASGTSGMKAASNGVLNCTVADGWSAEVNWTNTGWVLDAQKVAESLYHTLEHDIVPLFFDRNEEGWPDTWVRWMQNSISLADQFSARRMMLQYRQKLYQEQ